MDDELIDRVVVPSPSPTGGSAIITQTVTAVISGQDIVPVLTPNPRSLSPVTEISI